MDSKFFPRIAKVFHKLEAAHHELFELAKEIPDNELAYKHAGTAQTYADLAKAFEALSSDDK